MKLVEVRFPALAFAFSLLCAAVFGAGQDTKEPAVVAQPTPTAGNDSRTCASWGTSLPRSFSRRCTSSEPHSACAAIIAT